MNKKGKKIKTMVSKRGIKMQKIIPIIYLCTLFLNSAVAQSQWKRHQSPVNEGLHKIFFLNDKLGWIITYGTGKIIHTNDGGNSWKVQAKLNSEYFERIQFLNKNTGYVCGDFAHVYKTVNGGKNWINVSPDLSSDIPVNNSSKVAYYSMHFLNPDKGFVGGFKFIYQDKKIQSVKLLFYITIDGGKTWLFLNKEEKTEYMDKLQSLDIFKEKFKYDSRAIGAFYLDKKRAWKLGHKKNIKIVNRTIDGGKTWIEFQLPDFGRWITRNIVFLDGNRGFIAGGDTYYNLDRKVEFGKGILLYTKDGGKSWKRLDINYPSFHDIALSPDKIWIVGQEGTILSCKK